jgi:uncharacterized repeat protein (TIGR01451 family)
MAPLQGRKLQLGHGVAAPTRRALAAGPDAVVKHRSGRFAGLLLGLASAAAAAAQPAVESARELVVSSSLERLFAPAAGGDSPGVEIAAGTVGSHADQLIVSVRFTNSSRTLVDNVRITSPIPADVKYVPGSASGPGSEVLFSVDNGRTFGRPPELTLPAVDGDPRAADPADYTHVRWILTAPLDVGATGVARFRAVPR